MRLRPHVTTHGSERPAGGTATGALLLGAMLVGLAGCGNQRVTLDAPVQWWHDLEGGTIAEHRPPPPGLGLPYPKVGTVPARPALPDMAARVGQTDRLAAEREQAERAATRTPLPPPGGATTQALASEGASAAQGAPPAAAASGAPGAAAGGAAPPASGSGTTPAARAPGRTAGTGAPGVAPAPGAPAADAGLRASAAPDPTDAAPAAPGAAGSSVASATLAAASAPAPPPAPPPATVPKNPAGGPATPVQRATPQELAVLQGSAPAAGTPLVVAGQAADAGVVLPPLAGEPPPPPSFEAGAANGAAPATGQVAPLATREPLSRSAPQEPQSRRGTSVRFEPGTATLLAGQAGVLRALAAGRGAAPVAVTGYGDAAADTPDAQSEALSLGLRRAGAMSSVLGTYGVPSGAIRIAAEAFGRGGTVRLIH